MIDDAKELIRKNNGIVDKDTDQSEIFYFTKPSRLDLEMFASCQSDQRSVDAGEGKGGIWINNYIARGNFGDDMKFAKI